MKKISLYLLMAAWGITLISCGSSKEAPKPITPDPLCVSTKDALRAEGTYREPNASLATKARMWAKNNAQKDLAFTAKSFAVKVMDEYYANNYDGDDFEIKVRTEEFLNNLAWKSTITKEWSDQGSQAMTCHACIEMAMEDFLNILLDGISKDPVLGVGFQPEKFTELFNKEVQEFFVFDNL